MGRGYKALLATVAGLFVALITAAPASAHNSLTGSSPEDGARLAAAPRVVELTFLASLKAGGVTVTIAGPDGVSAAGGQPTVAGRKVTVPFRAGPAGLYTVAYAVASGDGHPVTGKVRFTLTVGATPTATPTPTARQTQPAFEPQEVAAPAEGDDDSNTLLWAGALVAVAVVAAGAWLLIRVRRASSGPPAGE